MFETVVTIVILAVVIGGGAWWWWATRSAQAMIAEASDIEDVHGAARCLRACEVLERAVDRGGRKVIERIWDRLEGPLLNAMPDCPPDVKPRLRRALEAAQERTRHRRTQQTMMDLRRSLIE